MTFNVERCVELITRDCGMRGSLLFLNLACRVLRDFAAVWDGGRLASVGPRIEEIADAGLTAALAALDWSAADFGPAFPPQIAFDQRALRPPSTMGVYGTRLGARRTRARRWSRVRW
ncbi:hypothetical protein [Streptomyces sp. NBC_01462]|uniref:hypothetical protein n=1 Tax=Streptomyces sp. NBC_01462 TaxID=2903876 RepID=UPI002E2F99B3|nr:hypothetical protein [Streptomyces sp. NBC_01462]